MSLGSTLALKIGLTDIDSKFEKYYNFFFDIQNFFDTNKERSSLLKMIKGYTHVNYTRLRFLWDITDQYVKGGRLGAFVETGVWRGGCAGIMAYLSKTGGYKNPLFFFDSFKGLPQPTAKDGIDAKSFARSTINGELKSIGKVKAEEYYVKDLLFKVLRVKKNTVKIVKGWFQNTLPKYKKIIGPIGILRLDGDWYESTKVSLENLYDLVLPGGYIIIDDYYYWEGCKKAVDEFIKSRELKIQMLRQDSSGSYFIKP